MGIKCNGGKIFIINFQMNESILYKKILDEHLGHTITYQSIYEVPKDKRKRIVFKIIIDNVPKFALKIYKFKNTSFQSNNPSMTIKSIIRDFKITNALSMISPFVVKVFNMVKVIKNEGDLFSRLLINSKGFLSARKPFHSHKISKDNSDKQSKCKGDVGPTTQNKRLIFSSNSNVKSNVNMKLQTGRGKMFFNNTKKLKRQHELQPWIRKIIESHIKLLKPVEMDTKEIELDIHRRQKNIQKMIFKTNIQRLLDKDIKKKL